MKQRSMARIELSFPENRRLNVCVTARANVGSWPTVPALVSAAALVACLIARWNACSFAATHVYKITPQAIPAQAMRACSLASNTRKCVSHCGIRCEFPQHGLFAA
jgi:hypothetical protein